MANPADEGIDINTDGNVISDYVHPHAVNAGIPVEEIRPPTVGNEFEVDEMVREAFPLPNTKLMTAHHYGSSLWGKIAKLVTKLENGKKQYYFLKIIPFENPGKQMCQGEFESLKAMHAILPSFIPKVYKWGPLKSGPGYFLLAEFREVGQQPPDPKLFTMRVAELHSNSESPNGKFGFHVPTFHGNLPTYTGWEDSWTVMYSKILARAMDIDQSKSDPGADFMAVRKILFDRVIPRLLDRLSSQGRSIKPCLVHGDLWDENCAIDMATGEPFAFDAGSLYAHNEYEIGYWRPPRHRLSNRAYIRSYKRHFPVSEPADEWDDRNLLYSMRFNIGCNVLIPASGQRAVVFEDMKTLCRKYYPHHLSAIDNDPRASGSDSVIDGEELEDEGDGLKLTLDHTASEMGLKSSDLVKGLQSNDEGGQTMPTEEAQQESSDPEPLDVGESEKVLAEPRNLISQEILPHFEKILVAEEDTAESSQTTQPLLPEVHAIKQPAAEEAAAEAMEALPLAIHASKPANKAEQIASSSTLAGNEEVVEASMPAIIQADTRSVLNEPPATDISKAEPRAASNKALGILVEDCEKGEASTPAKNEIEI